MAESLGFEGHIDVGRRRCHDGERDGVRDRAALSFAADAEVLRRVRRLNGGLGRHSAEFKQVTVLFADVVGSMDIAAAVGAERLREIMAELVRRGTAVVQRYGGTMDKFTGDGLMAVFGAPIALEDHAIRAGLAALGIQTEASGTGARCAAA